MIRVLALLRPALAADAAAVESDVRALIAEREAERIRQQVEAERDWLGTDVTTPEFLAEYLPGRAA
ncbi:hypothetical protein QUV83_16205 [Cellulomonas cellasea]|uniref:hypothetical protein n=1 Tax=Cellulomonas cellasea TaxID=43670 RepID=UPI0025A47F11|nr:hypothetical protein [Cellulomonas cellasea]MDM8086318.1 hypothetical protein [Cellulomonas cellasea]